MQKELAELQNSLDRAQVLDEEAVQTFLRIKPKLELMSGATETLRSALPKRNLLEEDPSIDGAASKRIEELLGKVRVLKSLREQLVKQFREGIAKDDITQLLITSSDPKAVIAAELPKHQKAAEEITKNFESQKKLLPALIEAHATYAGLKRANNALFDKQEAFVADLLGCFDLFRELQNRAKQAESFYQQFDERLVVYKRKLMESMMGRPPGQDPTPPPAANPFPKPSGSATPPPASLYSHIELPTDDMSVRRYTDSHMGRPEAAVMRRGSEVSRAGGKDHFRRLSVGNPFDAESMVAEMGERLRGEEVSSSSPRTSSTTKTPPVAHSSPPKAGGAALFAKIEEEEEEEHGGDGSMNSPKAANPDPLLSFSSPFTASGHSLRYNSALEQTVMALRQHVDELALIHPSGQSGFEKDFGTLTIEDLKFHDNNNCRVGLANTDKNRYRDIMPYDIARVRLLPADSTSTSDGYINASLIKSLLAGSPDFICSQGPMHSTVGDFWRMVKQQRVRVIVMVTNVSEGGRIKCEQYWPSRRGDTLSFPQSDAGFAVDVIWREERVFATWIERDLAVIEYRPDGTVTRKVTQFHFTTWPDRGTPNSPREFLTFRDAVARQFRVALHESRTAGEPQCPMLVHCSAGVGRTGTFCCIYAALEFLPHLASISLPGPVAKIDMLEIIRQMRKSRRYMVQTSDQYEFCYKCTLDGSFDFLNSVRPTSPSKKTPEKLSSLPSAPSFEEISVS